MCICVTCLPAYERSELVASKADLIIRVSNGAAFVKAIKESALGQLWRRPEMKAFLNNRSLEEALIKDFFTAEDMPPAKQAQAVALDREILSLFKGEIVVGFKFPETGEEVDFFALVEMDDAAYKKSRLLSRQENDLSGRNTDYRYSRFQGVELVREIEKGKKGEEVEWSAFYGSTFINGSDRAWMEQCIVRLKEELPRTPRVIPCVQVWLPEGTMDKIIKMQDKQQRMVEQGISAEEGALPPQEAGTFELLKAFGLTGGGKIFFEFKFAPHFAESSLRVACRAPGKGIWAMFSKTPVPRRHALAYVPADAVTYSVLRPDLQTFWKELPAILSTLDPQGAVNLRMGLDYFSRLLQIDIDRDIIANLDSLLTYYSRLEDGKSVTLYAWQLRNPRAVEKTLAKLFAEGSWLRISLQETFELLNLQEHKVYSINIPRFTPLAERGNSQNSPPLTYDSFAVAIAAGDLIFGRLGLVRSHINGSRDGKAGREFYRSPTFSRMVKRVPDTAIIYSISDVSQWLGVIVNVLKKSSRPPVSFDIEGYTPPEPGPLDVYLNNLGYDKLPPVSFLRSFFGPWVFYSCFSGREFTFKLEFHNPGGTK